jgi:hypothetical protein
VREVMDTTPILSHIAIGKGTIDFMLAYVFRDVFWLSLLFIVMGLVFLGLALRGLLIYYKKH